MMLAPIWGDILGVVTMQNGLKWLFMASLVIGLAGCAKVGSERWCKNLADKPKGDWTVNEAADYAKHCLLK